MASDGAGGDARWWLWWQLELELLDQEPEFWLRLGVAGQQQLAPVSCRQINIDHLDGGEFLESTARSQSRCQRMQATLQRDLQTIGQERDEDMGFDRKCPYCQTGVMVVISCVARPGIGLPVPDTS